MNDLVNTILRYESDTFSASGSDLTRQEAWTMAQSLFNSLIRIVEEGGQMRCDGTVLSELLDTIRDE